MANKKEPAIRNDLTIVLMIHNTQDLLLFKSMAKFPFALRVDKRAVTHNMHPLLRQLSWLCSSNRRRWEGSPAHVPATTYVTIKWAHNVSKMAKIAYFYIAPITPYILKQFIFVTLEDLLQSYIIWGCWVQIKWIQNASKFTEPWEFKSQVLKKPLQFIVFDFAFYSIFCNEEL